MKLRRNKKGFTIIELVIVIAVIGVLTAVLVPVFINLANKANEASDQSLITNLNKELEMKHAESGDFEPKYPSQAFDYLQTRGYTGETIIYNQKSDKEILWNSDKDRFLFAEDRDSAEFSSYPNVNFWSFKDNSENDERGYSVYLYSQFSGTVLDPTSGLDVGKNNDIATIDYTRASTDPAQEVVIRTNGGALTVNSPNDDINWYGLAKVQIDAVKDESFHAFGKPVGEVKIQSGHYVVESNYETNFNVGSNNVSITTKSTDDVIVLKGSGVSTYTVNGVAYTDSSVISGTTKKATIDDTKALLNANTNAGYNTFQEAFSSIADGDKLVLLKDLVVEDNSPVPSGNNNNAALTIRDKSFSLNGNGNTITSDGKHSGNYTSHDLFNLECGGSVPNKITMDIYNINIIATHYQDVFLLNSDVDYDFVLNLTDSSVVCDGESVYSNGPKAIAVLNGCTFVHEGQYALNKDDRYYSALIVGYGGFINAYNCKVESFGNGVTTFPSGGVVNLFNTDILIEPVIGAVSSGFAIRATMEPNSYEGLYVIRGAEISVYGGTVNGQFYLKDTSVAYDANINLYEGTFTVDPTAYVVDGKTCSRSGDNWIVF